MRCQTPDVVDREAALAREHFGDDRGCAKEWHKIGLS